MNDDVAMSRNLLCLQLTNGPFFHIRVWSTVFSSPQMKLIALFGIKKLYLSITSKMASWKYCLLRRKLLLFGHHFTSQRDVSQLEMILSHWQLAYVGIFPTTTDKGPIVVSLIIVVVSFE